MSRSSRSSQSSNPNIASKGCGTLFFGAFTLAGLLFFGLLVWSFIQTVRPYFWKATPCTIIESRRPSDSLESPVGSGDLLTIRYRYVADGLTLESTTIDKGMKESLDYKKVERLLFKYPVGAESICYVNSDNPSEVTLRRGPLWPMVFALIPLIFIGVGVGGLIGIWSNKPGSILGSKTTRTKELGPVGMILFFGIFTLVGGILGYFVAVRPVQKYFAAKSWPETPCEIVSSSVGSHRGSKGGTTYSIDITYRYQFGGREYLSDTYSVMQGSSSGRSGKEEVVERYPEGSKSVCYVNPADPTDTLLNRNLSPWLLIGLLPLLFFVIGISGLIHLAKSALRKSGRFDSSRSIPGIPHLPESTVGAPVVPSGPVELKPAASPIAKVLGAFIFAVFWNGITGVFVGFAVNSFIKGKPEWFLTIFITPFVLIGILLLGLVGSTLLNLFNPRLRISINSRTVCLGGTLDATWSWKGSSARIRRLKIVIEGREERTTGSGKNRSTTTKVFATVPVVDTIDSYQISQGSATSGKLPDSAKPNEEFDGRTRVYWMLKATGEIPWYPDVDDEYELEVVAR